MTLQFWGLGAAGRYHDFNVMKRTKNMQNVKTKIGAEFNTSVSGQINQGWDESNISFL
jgi:hypothetical protein